VNVFIIGGGAAGLMAAVTAAGAGASVTIAEPNDKPGRKLRITGKGRCNVTNDTDVRGVIANTPTGGKFLTSALTAFPPAETMAFFESIGVPLKTERGGRVFPVSDDANDIADALTDRAYRLGAVFKKDRVLEIICKDGAAKAVRLKSGGIVPADAVITATGGEGYPKTGSTGDGYLFAESAGHTVSKRRASLVPLTSPDAFCGAMQGLSLRNIKMKVFEAPPADSKKTLYEDFGELLFTHFGLSGPLALSASAHMRVPGVTYRLSVDLKPGLTDAQLEARLIRDLTENANKNFINSLGGLLPRLMIPVITERSAIEPEKKSHSVTKLERSRLFALLRSFDIIVDGTRPIDEAIITSGGVSTKEIVPATMESKLIRGLYFAGEVLDCDAYTGGFNLQIAWSTGRAAGKAAASRV